MLQQTQVARVTVRHAEFLERFPTPQACSLAPVSDTIKLWDGLGFNRRAVNLHRAASVITEQHDGEIPSDLQALLALPGIGPYTARALQAFAFELDVGVVDTNVGRLLARWTNRRLTAKQAQAIADDLVPSGQGWLWNQSLFDFAVAVCTKRAPMCTACPLADTCAWQGAGEDPAVASAGVSGNQSKFEGSERQVRGRIVNALRQGPIERSALGAFGRPQDDGAALDRIVQGLLSDGLVAMTADAIHLPID